MQIVAIGVLNTAEDMHKARTFWTLVALTQTEVGGQTIILEYTPWHGWFLLSARGGAVLSVKKKRTFRQHSSHDRSKKMRIV
jgi:hypothetical protein